jgi:hypothetical protein
MILMAANDAGPAEYMAMLARKLSGEIRYRGSQISSPVFNRSGIDSLPSGDVKSPECQLILTGTCLGDGIDKDMTRLGKDRGITTITFIDHWTLMKERFVTGAGETIFPDHIVINDDYAMSLAIEAGIPHQKLHALGNPVLENSDKLMATGAGNPQYVRENNNYFTNVILFVSEQLARDYEAGLYPDEGYDEFGVLEDIIATVGPRDLLLIKQHPQEEMGKYARYLADNIQIADQEGSLYGLIDHADFIVGMRSMLLLEASNVNGKIISYRPGATSKFIGNELGITFPVHDRESLARVFSGEVEVSHKRIMDMFAGSTTKISIFVKNQLH